MANEVAVKKNDILQALTNNLDASLIAVKDALPSDLNRQRFLQNTISVVKANPNLLQYNQTEVLAECLKASYLGLDFVSKEAWLVPYGSHVQFQLGYKGACKFAMKYSVRPIKNIYAKVVRENDLFEYGDKNGEEYLDWKGQSKSTDKMVKVYACVRYKDGTNHYEVMDKEEVDRIRRRSKCGSSGPWVSDYEEMAKKTVLKRLCKNIETDFDNFEQRAAWDSDNAEFTETPSAEVVDPFANDNVIEAEATIIDIPEVENFK